MTKKTKDAICVVCGKDFQASVFASLKTCRCDDCKNGKRPEPHRPELTPLERAELMARHMEMEPDHGPVVHDWAVPKVMQDIATPEVDQGTMTAYGESTRGPRIDGQPNKALARLSCPHHSHQPMKIIGVIKSSWGDMIDFQCQECFTRVQITDRPKNGYPLQTTACGTDFEPADIINKLDEGDISNI